MRIRRATFFIFFVLHASSCLAYADDQMQYVRRNCFQGQKSKLSRSDIESACRQFISSPGLTNEDKLQGYNSLGLASYYAGDYPQAIEVFDEALKLDPDYKNIIHNRGLALSYSKNYLEAIKSFEHIHKLDPDFPGSNSAIAEALMGLGRNEEALKFYSLAVIDSPHLESNYLTLGFLQMAAGKSKDAVENIESAARLNPEENQYPRYAALFAYIGGDLKTAKLDIEKAFTIAPKNTYIAVIRYFIGKAEGRNETAELERGLNLAIELNLWSKGTYLVLLGKKTAQEVLTEDAQAGENANPRQLQSNFYFGEMELLSNNRAQALSYFREAIKHPVDWYAEYWASLARIKQLDPNSLKPAH